MQQCSGVRPLESRAFISAPYCRSSSTIPASQVRHAKWSTLEPFCMSSISWLLHWYDMLELLEEGMLKESPVTATNYCYMTSCNFNSNNFVGVETFWDKKEIPSSAWPLIALTSTSDLTICLYTAFLSLAQMLSHTCCATERRRWLFVIRRTKTLSEYCNKRNHQVLSLRHL